MASKTVAASGGSDGFFGTLGTAFAEALGETTKTVLPRFAAKELGLQQVDPLKRPTQVNATRNTQFNPDGSPRSFQKAGLLFDNLNVNATGIIVVAVAIVAVFVLARN